jgi:hypothetical protein
MGKSVLLPRQSLEKIIELLESAELARLSNCCDYFDILRELKVKMQKLELRETYAKIINADSPVSRHDARIEYLWEKSQIGNVYIDDGAGF